MPRRHPEEKREELERLCEEQGLSLREAARRIGVAPSTAWRWQEPGREERNREEARSWAREHRERVVQRQRAYRRRRSAGK